MGGDASIGCKEISGVGEGLSKEELTGFGESIGVGEGCTKEWNEEYEGY